MAMLLTTFAGLSTCIGALIAFSRKKTDTRFLTVSMGFSAGVMIYVAFVELLQESITSLETTQGEAGHWMAVGSFFAGVFLIGIIDKLIPNFENPHEFHEISESERVRFRKLLRTGFLTAIVLAIHNLPEGIATFASSMKDISLGVPIAIAIAIHNIPEGIAVATPIYHATGKKRKAFLYTLLSGVAEPIGALIGYQFLTLILDDTVFGLLFGSIAGIMVFVALDQLLPAAEEYGEHHLAIYGLVGGMMVMALSLLVLH
jgi:ZIP family zinc transporter